MYDPFNSNFEEVCCLQIAGAHDGSFLAGQYLPGLVRCPRLLSILPCVPAETQRGDGLRAQAQQGHFHPVSSKGQLTKFIINPVQVTFGLMTPEYLRASVFRAHASWTFSGPADAAPRLT
jgi:hypothetical protein